MLRAILKKLKKTLLKGPLMSHLVRTTGTNSHSYCTGAAIDRLALRSDSTHPTMRLGEARQSCRVKVIDYTTWLSRNMYLLLSASYIFNYVVLDSKYHRMISL